MVQPNKNSSGEATRIVIKKENNDKNEYKPKNKKKSFHMVPSSFQIAFHLQKYHDTSSDGINNTTQYRTTPTPYVSLTRYAQQFHLI